MLEPVYRLLGELIPFPGIEATFVARALLGLLLVTPLTAAMGIQVINFRLAFFSDAISHSAFTGVALALIFSLDPVLSTVGFGVLVGLAITYIRRQSSLATDTIVGVFFSTVVALGIVLVSYRKGLGTKLHAFLYGDILALTDWEILSLAGLFVLVFCFLAFAYNRLLFVGVDRNLAHAYGVKTSIYEYIFAALLALVVGFSLRAVGMLLVTALLVVPPASARNVARSGAGVFWWAVLISTTSALAGLFTSVKLDVATGGAVVLYTAGWFFATWAWQKFSPSGR